MGDYLKVENWNEYQHYKHRDPPWIKLYHRLIDNYEYGCLQDASKLLLFSLYMLAARTNNRIPADPEWIKSKAMMSQEIDLSELIAAGFISCSGNVATRYQPASNPLATCSFRDRDRDRDRVETETDEETTSLCRQLTDEPPAAADDEKTKPTHEVELETTSPSKGLISQEIADFASWSDPPFPPPPPADLLSDPLTSDPAGEDQPLQVEPPKEKTPPYPHQEIIALWHEIMPDKSVVLTWSKTRMGMLRSRWKEDAERQNLDWWKGFFEFIRESDFLMGRTSSPGRKCFDVSLPWVIRPENLAKIIEGNYHH
jgi:hypothetical protein